MAKKPKKVSLDKYVYDFYLAEAQAIDALCDRAQVPQTLEDEPLSMAQRVAILEGLYQELLVKYLMKDPLVLQ